MTTYKVVFMQVIVSEQKPEKGFKLKELPIEDKQKLVDVFVWLMQEDKKQNPVLYQLKKQ